MEGTGRRGGRTLVLVAVAVVFLAALPARAAENYTVQITQIQASGRGGGEREIDPRLRGLSKQLRAYPYRVYRLIGSPHAMQLAAGETGRMPLAEGGFALEVRAGEGSRSGFIALELTMTDTERRRTIMSTRLHLRDGGTSLVIKELEHERGALILAIAAARR
ncbi:MAG: hypothetical protein KatS3mg102_0754 [Planctomycetota bacterium]|nr:MAG: hypothetical protein KatS3mg102_0754 [Planctomycetota bacterium]